MKLQVANKLRSESQRLEQVIRSRYNTPIYATMVCDIHVLFLCLRVLAHTYCYFYCIDKICQYCANV